MITLIGTGHVFDLSKALLDIFDEKQPELLCVELDKQRYHALMLKQSDPEKYEEQSKNLPIIYKLLSRFQDNMAKEYGVQAGQEMLTTIQFAQSRQLPLAFIDMNAQRLFTKMLKSMTFREKIRMFFSGFAGFFVSKKRVEKELDKLEDNFDIYMEEIGKKFPTIKRVLVDDRNQYMAQQLVMANEQYGKIIAVLGDGHVPGISEMLKKKEIEFETIRLKDIRNKKVKPGDTSTASFSMNYEDIN